MSFPKKNILQVSAVDNLAKSIGWLGILVWLGWGVSNKFGLNFVWRFGFIWNENSELIKLLLFWFWICWFCWFLLFSLNSFSLFIILFLLFNSLESNSESIIFTLGITIFFLVYELSLL